MSLYSVLLDAENGLWHDLAQTKRFDESREWATFVVVHAMSAWMSNTSIAPGFDDAILAAARDDDNAYADAIDALTDDGKSAFTESIRERMNDPKQRAYLRAIGRVILALDGAVIPLLAELDPIFDRAQEGTQTQ